MMDFSAGEYERSLRVILCYVGSIAILLVGYIYVLLENC